MLGTKVSHRLICFFGPSPTSGDSGPTRSPGEQKCLGLGCWLPNSRVHKNKPVKNVCFGTPPQASILQARANTHFKQILQVILQAVCHEKHYPINLSGQYLDMGLQSSFFWFSDFPVQILPFQICFLIKNLQDMSRYPMSLVIREMYSKEILLRTHWNSPDHKDDNTKCRWRTSRNWNPWVLLMGM